KASSKQTRMPEHRISDWSRLRPCARNGRARNKRRLAPRTLQRRSTVLTIVAYIEGRIAMTSRALPVALLATLLAGASALAQTPSWTPPPDNARCPSKWGAGDERGAGNHMKPQSVLNAIKLIKTGEVIELGHVLNAQMPMS